MIIKATQLKHYIENPFDCTVNAIKRGVKNTDDGNPFDVVNACT